MRADALVIVAFVASGCAGRGGQRTAAGGAGQVQAPVKTRVAASNGSAAAPPRVRDAAPPAAQVTVDANPPVWEPPPATAVDPCERACEHLYSCLAINEVPIYAHCLATCARDKEDDLRQLAALRCGELDARLAAGGAAIERRTCAELVAARPGRPAPPGWRDALISHPWCVGDEGPIERGTLHFEDRAVLWGARENACWTLDDRRLRWSPDGVSWRSAEIRLRRGGDRAVIDVGAQQLTVCVEPRPERPGEPLRPAGHDTSSSMR